MVALDDFGAGQSNLGLLQRLPISGLKLAPDLVAALGEDADTSDAGAAAHPAALETDNDSRAQTLSREAAALVRGLIELGRALELTVVAQGVESGPQAAALRALGCEYAQGPFLVGHDVAADLHDVTDDVPEDKPQDKLEDEPEQTDEPEDEPEDEDEQTAPERPSRQTSPSRRRARCPTRRRGRSLTCPVATRRVAVGTGNPDQLTDIPAVAPAA